MSGIDVSLCSPIFVRFVNVEGEGCLRDKIGSVDLGDIGLCTFNGKVFCLGGIFVAKHDVVCTGDFGNESTQAVVGDLNRNGVYGVIVCYAVDGLAAINFRYGINVSAGCGECKGFKLEFTACIRRCIELIAVFIFENEAEFLIRNAHSVQMLVSAESYLCIGSDLVVVGECDAALFVAVDVVDGYGCIESTVE